VRILGQLTILQAPWGRSTETLEMWLSLSIGAATGAAATAGVGRVTTAASGLAAVTLFLIICAIALLRVLTAAALSGLLVLLRAGRS
jgi:hypothetical protein